MTKLTALLAFSALIVQGKPDDFFPTTPGTQWRYDGSFRFKGPVISTVLQPEEIEKTRYVVIETRGRGGPTPTEEVLRDYYLCNAESVVLAGRALKGAQGIFEFKKLAEPETILKLPLKVGAKWNATADAKSATLEVTAQELLKTPAGELKCLVIKSSDRGGLLVSEMWWYAPGVGLVQEGALMGTRSQSLRTLEKFTAAKP